MISTWPSYDANQISLATNVLKSGNVNYWTGSACKSFEKEFSDFCNLKYSIAIANGSLSLLSAYYSIGLTYGDEFITTPRTFIATASSGIFLGAKPIFADVEIDSGLISANKIEPLITKKTKAISVVHLAGWPANMTDIVNLASAYRLSVVEDCAQAHGALFNNKSVGSFGDISAWSFCQDKIISTAGEGGMVSTNSKYLMEKLWSFKDHGKNRLLSKSPNTSSGFRWLTDSIGLNLRLTEFQSEIGRYQLSLLPIWNSIRTKNALMLIDSLTNIPSVRVPIPTNEIRHAWYKFYCYVRPNYLKSGWDRNRIIAEIISRGMPAYHGGCGEIYLEKCFSLSGLRPPKRLPNARQLSETSIMLLVDHTISEENMIMYSACVRDIFLEASLI